MCTYRYAVERAVILGYEIVAALRNVTLDTLVFLLFFHVKHLRFGYLPCADIYIIDGKLKIIHVLIITA